MRVDTGRRAVSRDDAEEALDVVAQPLGSNSRVLDEGERLRVLPHGHRQAQSRLSQAPDTRLRREFKRVVIAIAKPVRAKVLFERLEPRREVLGAIVVELDAEQRARDRPR